MSIITVMGATGRIGSRVTGQLLKAGEQVRAQGRSAEKLAALKEAGAETFAGEVTDTAFLTSLFRGADAVYTLLPYSLQETDYMASQRRQGEVIVEAIRQSGVRHVVFLSSIGADLETDTGMLESMHEQEMRLRTLSGVNVTILRPGSFMENFYEMLGLIKHQGINGEGVIPDLAIPMISTRDIADAAVRALRARDAQGVVVQELLGPRDVSYTEATRIIGERIGMPDLPYVQFPYEDLVGALTEQGFSENIATMYLAIARGINEGRVRSVEGRNAANSTPTPFEEFANEFAAAYRAMS